MIEKTTVAIVGAGPPGLLLAGDLARAGVDVTVRERRGTESNLTRAFGVGLGAGSRTGVGSARCGAQRSVGW